MILPEVCQISVKGAVGELHEVRLSDTKENGTRIICRASHKYEHLKIQLVKRKNTSIRSSKDKKSWFDVEPVSNVFTDIPLDYVKVEEQFLLKD